MLPEAHETTIDGIPTFWTDIAESPSVTVTFGVGMRDEPAELSGVTHLLEHLVFSSMAPLTMVHNGSTGSSVLTFNASGAPADLITFVHLLTAAVRSLRSVTEAEIVREKKVLETETTFRFAQPACGLLAYRYGYGGIGKSSGGTVALPSLTVAEVVSWANTHLTRDNVALAFVGMPPDGITIDLPQSGQVRRPAELDVIAVPTVMASERHALAFSLVTPPVFASHVACVLEHEIMKDLRQRHGLIYSTEMYLTDIDEERTAIEVILDPLTDHVVPALERLLDVLGRMRDEGVEPAAVDYSMNALREAVADRAASGSHLLGGLAYGYLLDVTPQTPERAVAIAQTVTTSSITDLLRMAMTGLLVAVDADQEIPDDLFDRHRLTRETFQMWDEAGIGCQGPDAIRWRARRRGDTPGFRLAIDDTHLRMTGRHTDVGIRLDSLAFVACHDDGWIGLMDQRGRGGGVDMTDYRRGDTIIEELRARVPENIVRTMPAS